MLEQINKRRKAVPGAELPQEGRPQTRTSSPTFGRDDESEEETVEVEVEVEESDGSSSVGERRGRRRRRNTPCHFTEEQELEIVRWYQDHPCLYNKGLKSYRDQDKKKHLWQDMAQKLKCTPCQLNTWINSQRTRYGKLTATKSGQGAPSHLTERDQWIKKSWAFLEDHIVRVPSRQNVSRRLSYDHVKCVKKRKRNTPCHFTEEKEMDIVQWYRDNPCLYNKGLTSYKDQDKRSHLWQDMAHKVKCTPSQLNTWINSQRTRYGKLTGTKSGQGAPSHLTERDQWIKKSWAFLEDHIVRVPSRQSFARSKMSAATTEHHVGVVSASYFASALPPLDSSDEDQSHSSSSQASYEGKKWKHKRTSSGEDPQQALFERLMEQASQTSEESKALTAPKTANKCAVDAFVSYLSTQLVQIREEDWLPFTVDTIQLVNSYITRARAAV